MADFPAQKKQGGLWGNLGLLPKILIFVGLAIIVTTILFGFNLGNIGDFIWGIIRVLLGLGLLYLAVKGALSFIGGKPFSPTADFRTKIVSQAQRSLPANVYSLWLRGEDSRTRAIYGKIIGLAWIPYLTSKVVRDESGNIVYLMTTDGQKILDKDKKPIPLRSTITHKDGDTVFVVKSGFFDAPRIVRCHPKYHSELLGDVYIKDVNLVPFGEFWYPSKQWQNDIIQIMKQNEQEAIVQTFNNNLDLVSNVTTLSIASELTFRKILESRNEEIARPVPQSFFGGQGR